jgi:hypothetical protein
MAIYCRLFWGIFVTYQLLTEDTPQCRHIGALSSAPLTLIAKPREITRTGRSPKEPIHRFRQRPSVWRKRRILSRNCSPRRAAFGDITFIYQ